MNSRVRVVTINVDEPGGEPLACGNRELIGVELVERQQCRASDRDIAIGNQAVDDLAGVGAAGPEAIDHATACCGVWGMNEEWADMLPATQSGQGNRRIGLAALVWQASVWAASLGRCRAGGRGFQEHEGVGHVVGIVGIKTGDGAPADRVHSVVGEQSGQWRQQVLRTGRRASAQRAMSRPFSAISLAATSGAHVLPSRISRLVSRQGTGGAEALAREPLAVFENVPK